MSIYKKMLAEFKSKGIPVDKPDFYDHPNFILAERNDPSYLNNYAAFVAAKKYSEDYLSNARRVITNTANILHHHLLANGREGACVDMTGIFARILENEGIWCAGIKGSCTIEFPSNSGEENTHFWSVDHGDFKAGHSWLFAPPFNIVDITLRKQDYSGNKKHYIPDMILEDSGIDSNPEIEDIISPSAITELQMHKVPRKNYFNAVAQEMLTIQKTYPTLITKGKLDTKIKYCPVAIHASEEPLEGLKNMKFDGMYALELYQSKIKGKV
tara:strand:- start:14802 stop:15611 length:810 start_codon:yes stop_codon:yes gene_type:complete